MSSIIIIITSLLLSPTGGTSDKECKVLMESIASTYDGDCKKGLAEGTGTARGADTYSGEFSKGYPEGLGRYIWNNGNFYSGNFAQGQKDGYGELHIKREGQKDSLIAGYWKKDVYIGQANAPYVVHSSANIKNITFEKKSDRGKEIYIKYQQKDQPIAAEGLRLINEQGVKPASEFDYSILRQIEFPFLGTRLEFRSKTHSGVSILECAAAFDIFEEGKWVVTIEVE